MSTSIDDLARRVREERRRRGWSQSDLATEAGVYTGTVLNFETRQSDRHDHNLRRSILSALGLTDEDPADQDPGEDA